MLTSTALESSFTAPRSSACPVYSRGHNTALAIDDLILATRGIALRGAPISIAQQNAISSALSAFDLEAFQGPYGAFLHAADIAISRPDLTQSILALNAARNLFIHLLEELK